MDDKVKKYLMISLGIVLLTAVVLPCFSPQNITNGYEYKFGFPLAYFHISSVEQNSMLVPMLFMNGIKINFDIVRFAIDVGIFYFIISKWVSLFENRKLGVGSLSVLVFILAISFFITIEGYGIVGSYVLNKFGFKLSTGKVFGISYSTIFPLLLFIVSFFLGKRYYNDLGAELGTSLSAFMGVFLSFLLFIRVLL